MKTREVIVTGVLTGTRGIKLMFHKPKGYQIVSVTKWPFGFRIILENIDKE
jgi:hypothetical protein